MGYLTNLKNKLMKANMEKDAAAKAAAKQQTVKEQEKTKVDDVAKRFAHNLYTSSNTMRTAFLTKEEHDKVMKLPHANEDGYYLSFANATNYMWLKHDSSCIQKHFVELDADLDGYTTAQELHNVDLYCKTDAIGMHRLDNGDMSGTIYIGSGKVADFLMTSSEASNYNKLCNNVSQTAFKRC